MNYEDMSDDQIDLAVDERLGRELGIGLIRFRYCRDWADAGPIIFDNRISTEWASGDDWRATVTTQGQAGPYLVFTAMDENPRRAAMIVYLKMQDAKS